MKIIGGDFNAEIGPGEGIELSSVGHYTLNKANCRGEWMTQWLLDTSLVALEHDVKQITAETGDLPYSERSKEAAGLLDHFLVTEPWAVTPARVSFVKRVRRSMSDRFKICSEEAGVQNASQPGF